MSEDTTEISPQDLKRRMDGGEPPLILDVREPYEVQLASIPGATLIPMGELRNRLGELDANQEIVVMCRTGKRSDMAAEFLRRHGYQARNLRGGIHAWSDDVDPTVTKY